MAAFHGVFQLVWLPLAPLRGVIREGFLASAPPLIIFFVVWSEPRLLRVASLCVVVTLAVLNIYLFIYSHTQGEGGKM